MRIACGETVTHAEPMGFTPASNSYPSLRDWTSESCHTLACTDHAYANEDIELDVAAARGTLLQTGLLVQCQPDRHKAGMRTGVSNGACAREAGGHVHRSTYRYCELLTCTSVS